MPRKKTKSLQRKLMPDRKYNSVLVQRLINKVMLNGKKQVDDSSGYEAMELAAKKLKAEEPLAVFEKAIKNVYPSMEVKSRRVGGFQFDSKKLRFGASQAVFVCDKISFARLNLKTNKII